MQFPWSWWVGFKPTQPRVSGRELTLSVVGAALGLLGSAALSHLILGQVNPWFIAPMGASTVLLFAAPASPLAQPWPMLAGNLVSAVVGVACMHAFGHGVLAAGLAGAGAIAAMFALRCLHPPGGAVALTAVLGGPAIAELSWRYVLWPAGLNSLLLLALALLYSTVARRPYPHRPAPHPHGTTDPLPSARLGFNRADLDAALASQGHLLDITRDDLEQVLVRAQLQASRRQFGDLLCEDIMSRDVVAARPRDGVDAAWAQLITHKVKALPVVRDDGTLAGIVSLHDFFLAQSAPDPRKLPVMNTARHVQDIMTRRVRVARPAQPLVELVELFSDGGLHHLPVVDEALRVVGMITQSDVVAALFKASHRPLAPTPVPSHPAP
ncbi:HPP family protein [Hylemonella sp. W303a]|uniref:HPP family protein n=1 Tax=Hylemonella sp. W303a TaxID=3389873 RepID=UPI00396B089D